MGIFLNPDHPGHTDFQQVLNSESYVDKTALIEAVNHVIQTEQKYLCISRPAIWQIHGSQYAGGLLQ